MATYHSLQGSLEEYINDPHNTFDTKLVERVKTNSIRGPLELVFKSGDSYATFKVFLKEAQDAPKITFEDDAKTFPWHLPGQGGRHHCEGDAVCQEGVTTLGQCEHHLSLEGFGCLGLSMWYCSTIDHGHMERRWAIHVRLRAW